MFYKLPNPPNEMIVLISLYFIHKINQKNEKKKK